MRVNYLDTSGIILLIIYFLIILGIFSFFSSSRYQNDNQLRKYFIYGLLFKLIAGIGFAFIYDFYYNRGGDTFAYFNNACRLGDVFFTDPIAYFRMLFDRIDRENIYTLSNNLRYYPYFRDPSVYAVHRYLSFFTIIGLKNYYLTSLCINAFLFILNWKVFDFFRKLFPEKPKLFAIALLFVPSIAFWGSGIIKDSFTYTFALLIIVYAYRLLFERKFSIFNILKFLFCVYILIELKPYILFAVIGSVFVWFGFGYIKLVKNRILRVFVLPVIMLIAAVVGSSALGTLMSVAGGHYSDMDAMLNKAVVSQQDLKQDYYDGASFDIGDYEPTFSGAASVAPAAILAGLYRPFLWEARSLVMIFSGLENTILLLLTLYLIIKAGPKFIISTAGKEPFLIFCFIFAIIMSLGIGLSTSNFGALVRFKIPLIPFLLIFLLWIRDEHLKTKT